MVTLTYAGLNAYLKSQGEDFTVSAGPPGELKVTGHLHLFGQSVALSADAIVRPGSGELQVTPTQLDTGTALDGVSRDLLNQRFTFAIFDGAVSVRSARHLDRAERERFDGAGEWLPRAARGSVLT